jgi:hypothetical protein
MVLFDQFGTDRIKGLERGGEEQRAGNEREKEERIRNRTLGSIGGRG